MSTVYEQCREVAPNLATVERARSPNVKHVTVTSAGTVIHELDGPKVQVPKGVKL